MANAKSVSSLAKRWRIRSNSSRAHRGRVSTLCPLIRSPDITAS
jgi:hypothetical protein